MNKNCKYKNIIFDMGGVLVNWKPKQIVQDIFKDKECMPFEKWFQLFHSDIFKNLDRGTILQKAYLEMLPKDYNKGQVEYLFKHLYKHLFPLKRGVEIFNLVKSGGYKIYVLSNFGKEAFEKSSYQYDFLDKFDGDVFSFKVKLIKPEPQIYQTLLENYSLDEEQCLFIDDMPVNIYAGKNLGIDGIICKDHDYLLQELQRLGVVDNTNSKN